MSLKDAVRDAAALFLQAAGASNLQRVARGKLLILTFHRVLPAELRAQYPLPGLVVTPDELKWILTSLVSQFDIHPVSEAVSRLGGAGSRPLLAVSFDDGQVDNLWYAEPVLKELGISATFYVPTSYIGADELLWHDRAGFAWQRATVNQRSAVLADAPPANVSTPSPSEHVPIFLEWLKHCDPDDRAKVVGRLERSSGSPTQEWARLMTWEEVARVQAAGHEIGSHSCTHALLPQLDETQQAEELRGSLETLAKRLGMAPRSMCYPNGSYDARTVRLTAEAGYENAVTTNWGINDHRRSRFELVRCDMDVQRLLDRNGSLSRARLAMRLAGLQPGLRPRNGGAVASASSSLYS